MIQLFSEVGMIKIVTDKKSFTMEYVCQENKYYIINIIINIDIFMAQRLEEKISK